MFQGGETALQAAWLGSIPNVSTKQTNYSRPASLPSSGRSEAELLNVSWLQVNAASRPTVTSLARDVHDTQLLEPPNGASKFCGSPSSISGGNCVLPASSNPCFGCRCGIVLPASAAGCIVAAAIIVLVGDRDSVCFGERGCVSAPWPAQCNAALGALTQPHSRTF